MTRCPNMPTPARIRVITVIAVVTAFVVAVLAAPFVRHAAGAPGGTISPITFTATTRNGRPVGAAQSFAAGTRRIYAVFRFAELRAADRLEGRWLRAGQRLLTQSTTLGEIFGSRFPGKGRLWFWIQWEGGAPPGTYRFELRLNGQPARTGTFTVTPP